MSGPSSTTYGQHGHLHALRLPRLGTPSASLVIGVSLGILMVFVSADVTLYASQPVIVQVTAVEWFIPGGALATTSGFSMHNSEWVTVTLTCSSVCFRFNGATVESPFALESFSVVYHPIQYVNVTVQSPSFAYSGPIAIELNLG